MGGGRRTAHRVNLARRRRGQAHNDAPNSECVSLAPQAGPKVPPSMREAQNFHLTPNLAPLKTNDLFRPSKVMCLEGLLWNIRGLCQYST